MENDVTTTLAECAVGEWVRLRDGWWRLGQPLAGGVGARPRVGESELMVHDAPSWKEDLGKNWPAVLDLDEVVIERRNDGEDAATS